MYVYVTRANIRKRGENMHIGILHNHKTQPYHTDKRKGGKRPYRYKQIYKHDTANN